MVLITIEAYEPTYNWGAPHCTPFLNKPRFLEGN